MAPPSPPLVLAELNRLLDGLIERVRLAERDGNREQAADADALCSLVAWARERVTEGTGRHSHLTVAQRSDYKRAVIRLAVRLCRELGVKLVAACVAVADIVGESESAVRKAWLSGLRRPELPGADLSVENFRRVHSIEPRVAALEDAVLEARQAVAGRMYQKAREVWLESVAPRADEGFFAAPGQSVGDLFAKVAASDMPVPLPPETTILGERLKEHIGRDEWRHREKVFQTWRPAPPTGAGNSDGRRQSVGREKT